MKQKLREPTGQFAAECCIAVSASSAHSEASGPPSNSNQVQLALPPYGPRHHLGNSGYFQPFCCSLCWDGRDLHACVSLLRNLCVLLPVSRSLLCSETKKGQQMGSHRFSPGAWQDSPSHSHSPLGLSLLHIIYTGLKSSLVSADSFCSFTILRAPWTLKEKV